MGYAVPQQTAAGIHTRLFSRAFIVDDGQKRVVFITADIGMVSQRLRLEVCLSVCLSVCWTEDQWLGRTIFLAFCLITVSPDTYI